MTKQQDTLHKAYDNVPTDIGFNFDFFSFMPTPRGIRYYYLILKRKFTR